MTGLWEPTPLPPAPDAGRAPWQTAIRKRRGIRADILRKKLRARKARRAAWERFCTEGGTHNLVAVVLCAVAVVTTDLIL